MLIDEDLPEGWRLVDPSALKSEKESDGIDIVVNYQRSANSAPGSELRKPREGSWFRIRHTETGIRVLLRLQRRMRSRTDPMAEVRITGVVFLPCRAGGPITSQHLRQLPTAKIEAAINKRLFVATWTSELHGGKMVLPSGRTLLSHDVLTPLGNPKRTPNFYELVALQHAQLSADGEHNPTATMARISDVAVSTAQGWVLRARSRGLLPPGRRGRIG